MDFSKLPKSYQPEHLRPVPEEEGSPNEFTLYAVGWTDKDAKEVGFCDGPNPDLSAMLEHEPRRDESTSGKFPVIVAFAGRQDDWKGHQIIYIWHKDEWRRIDTL